MIRENNVDVYIMPADNPRLFGTPSELCSSFSCSFNQLLSENAWNGNQRKTLVVDVDGTICGPPINGDYSKCEPLLDVISKLRDYDSQGVYIILSTARNMRTYSGSIGLINKYTAPFSWNGLINILFLLMRLSLESHGDKVMWYILTINVCMFLISVTLLINFLEKLDLDHDY